MCISVLLSSDHLEYYRMSSIDSSVSEGRYRRRRRRNDYQTLSNCVESSILQCTAVVFPTLPSTNIHNKEVVPLNRIYRTHRNRRKSVPTMISSYLAAMVIISIIAVNNCCCYAFQSPAIIQRSSGFRIQHGLVSWKIVLCVVDGVLSFGAALLMLYERERFCA